jgi:siroheme synthase (precorrin-2 oxidase/ferrochelatase)
MVGLGSCLARMVLERLDSCFPRAGVSVVVEFRRKIKEKLKTPTSSQHTKRNS